MKESAMNLQLPTSERDMLSVIRSQREVMQIMRSGQLAKANSTELNPSLKWTDLETMPGMQSEFIRKLGRETFSHFDIKESSPIFVIASLKNRDYINTIEELNRVLRFLEKNAEKVTAETKTLDFGHVIEGYSAEVKLYQTEGYAYLAVFEDTGIEGRYIYVFEREETKELGENLKLINQ
jgi:hypothetical protein